MALHEQCIGATDEWFTPPYIFDALGCTFDMDVASPGQHITPWIPARTFITTSSLSLPWIDYIWMNPPFGPRNGLVPWLEKFTQHANGVCLTPDRNKRAVVANLYPIHGFGLVHLTKDPVHRCDGSARSITSTRNLSHGHRQAGPRGFVPSKIARLADGSRIPP